MYTKEIEVLSLIADRIEGRSSREIALTIGAMISCGDLQPGDRLPTVRAVADRIGVSSSTVADSWRILTAHGAIDTARRNGTTVRSARAEMTGRFWQVPSTLGASIVDLSTGTPDTDLLPPLGPVLHRLHADVSITSYIDRPVLLELEHELNRRWPFVPQSLTVVNGALDALDHMVAALVRLGDTVVVEDPTFPPILDMLERAGARIVGVQVDRHGPVVESWAEAMAKRPTAAFIQPTAHNPTGASLTPRRCAQLAEAVADLAPNCWVVEDNHSGAIAQTQLVSLGEHMADRVVHIHSFSKSHGPDLRIAAVGGAEEPISTVIDRRRLGPSWTSRLIQNILLTMLTDAEVETQVAHAVQVYSERRRFLRDALAAEGITTEPGEGLNMWIPVADEQRAVVALALDNVGVAIGHPFRLHGNTDPDHIRVSIGSARGDLGELAMAIASAARA